MNPTNPACEVFNIVEAARFLNVHVETVRRLARKGEIPAFKVGKDWRLHREALLNWVKGHRERVEPPCVLVVDDEISVQGVVGRFLRAEGCEVRQALDGEAALRSLESGRVDLILLDLQMPGMSGPQFLQLLRAARQDVPVIVITGYPDSDLMLEAMRYGPVTLLGKPIAQEPLGRAVRGVLSGRLPVRA